MHYLHQVTKAIDYIELHLDEDVSLKDIAVHVGISQWHFARIFKALTNETLKTYIRARRLSAALNMLLNSDERIIEIAIGAGYGSQESFSRAFKKIYQMSPNEIRQVGERNWANEKIRIDEAFLKHINQHMNLKPTLYQQDKLRLVGIKTEFYSSDSDKNNIAEMLPPLWQVFLKRVAEIEHRIVGNMYGVIVQLADDYNKLEYYAAVPVAMVKNLPVGMSVVDIPSSSYAKFAHRGDYKYIDKSVDYIYSNWLLQSPYQHNYGPDIEIYGAQYQPGDAASIIEYAIPINPISTTISPIGPIIPMSGN